MMNKRLPGTKHHCSIKTCHPDSANASNFHCLPYLDNSRAVVVQQKSEKSTRVSFCSVCVSVRCNLTEHSLCGAVLVCHHLIRRALECS